jgi:hypothetical protein
MTVYFTFNTTSSFEDAAVVLTVHWIATVPYVYVTSLSHN